MICAFPILPMEGDDVMLRNAGCNTHQLISAQLTYFVTQYLPSTAYKDSTKRYGHYGPDILECIGITEPEVLFHVALHCISSEQKYPSPQRIDGFNILTLSKDGMAWIKNIDSTNELIYRVAGTTQVEELSELKSIEIPIQQFLEKLLSMMKQHYEKNYEAGTDTGPGGKYFYEEGYQKILKIFI